jgi:hypothetical protein
MKNKKTDYILLGSSRMANMVSGHQLDSLLHKSSINLATQASSYGESYAVFYEYLKNGNEAKTLVLTFDLFKDIHHNKDREIVSPIVFKQFELFPYYNDPEIRRVFADHSKEWELYAWEYIPIFRYAEFNNYFKIDQIANYVLRGIKDKPVFDTITGERIRQGIKFDGERRAAPENVFLGPRGEKYLLEILKLAKKNKMNIILVTAPYYDVIKTDLTKHKKFLSSLEVNYKARYLDFSTQEEWKNKNYFYDPIHTNIIGSRIYTRYLADSLKKISY